MKDTTSQRIRATAGLWSDVKETGLEYEKRMRDPWKKRRKQIP